MQIATPAIILALMGIFFGAGLAWASKFFKTDIDPRTDSINRALPGANCGACGYPGCQGLAAAIAASQAPVNACPVGGSECAAAIAAIMGVEAATVDDRVATVICQGADGICKKKYQYEGYADCRAAALASGGYKACRYACLGLGTCAANCPFDAIVMQDGFAHIDPAKCHNCGMCIAVCPKNVMRMEPRDRIVSIRCRATEKGKAVHDACFAGCIACGRCAKACQYGAIVLEDNLPTIDYEKCVQCLDCAHACPTGAIWGEGIDKAKKWAGKNP